MKLATLCYVRRGRDVLMLHRTRKVGDVHAGKYNGLGGKFEPGESPEQCVLREVREESGLTVADPLLRGVLTFPAFAHGEDWYVFVFTARWTEGEVSDCPEGELRWVPRDRLLDLPLWEGDRLFLPLLDEPGIFSGRLVYENGRLTDSDMTLHALPGENCPRVMP